MTLIEVPKGEQRVVQVAIPVAETQRGVAGFEYQDVREQWIHEPRCRDKVACAERVKALEPVVVALAEPVVEEGPSWLL